MYRLYSAIQFTRGIPFLGIRQDTKQQSLTFTVKTAVTKSQTQQRQLIHVFPWLQKSQMFVCQLAVFRVNMASVLSQQFYEPC